MLAKDEFERNFISAVVPPHEIGVKFEDVGALEDVKKTLDELVTLPMRRPELFSRGNLLRVIMLSVCIFICTCSILGFIILNLIACSIWAYKLL